MHDLVERAPAAVLPAAVMPGLPAVRWGVGTRIAFRFCACETPW